MFRDRLEAGQRLAREIAGRIGQDPALGGENARRVVIALPRGGVPVAAEVAREIGAPLDIVLVRKIGVPWQPELAAAAVVDGDDPVIVRNEFVIREARVDDADLAAGVETALTEIARRRERYLGGRAPVPVEDAVTIVIDDGLATGTTALAALRSLRKRNPASLVLAVPVAPPDGLGEIRAACDRLIALEQPTPFYATGAHFARFDQVDDETVSRLLDENAAGQPR